MSIDAPRENAGKVSDLLDTLCSIKIPWKEFHGIFLALLRLEGTL